MEDVVVFLNYIQKCHRDLSQGATAQLLVMCNRTAVHNQLLQHGFQAAWFGGLRIATTSSAAGATTRIAVVVQTWIPQRWPSRCLPRRQGRLFWEGHSGADTSNPTHVHCLPHRHGWDDRNGSNVSGLPLWLPYPQKQASPVS